MTLAVVPIRNRLMELVEKRQMTRYEFWQRTGLSQNTAYKLCDNADTVPSKQAMDKIYEAFGWEPGDYLYAVKEDEGD